MNIEHIHECFLSCHSASTDTRKITKNSMFFALKGANFDGNTFTKQAIEAGAKYVVIDNKNYETKPHTILVENVLETLQKLAAFHRNHLKIPIIALTGSNGKTTTKELINAVLSKKHTTTATVGNLNNHIGVPLTLLSMTKNTDIGIVEMGANHLNEIEALCNIALPDFGYITNFGKAHLEGFGSVEGVIKGKTELYKYLIENNKTIIVNTNDVLQVSHSKGAKTITFGTDTNENDITIELISCNPFVNTLYKKLNISSHLIGDYNFNNISAAIAIGNYFKVPDLDIQFAIENYIPDNNRSQIINQKTNNIILDAYNANPSSMNAALLNYSNQSHKNKWVILGDMFELGSEAEKEHQSIVDLVSNLNIDNAVLIGENFNKTKIASNKIKVFKTFQDFEAHFNAMKIKDALILIKGSRGMALERTLKLL